MGVLKHGRKGLNETIYISDSFKVAKMMFKLHRATSLLVTTALSVGIAFSFSYTATENMRMDTLNPEKISWIGGILPLGAILGGLLAGYLSNVMGRKVVMVSNSLPLVLGWLIIACAGNSLTLLYIGRFITGICCGVICVVTPIYLVEMSIHEVRGAIVSKFQYSICNGIIISAAAGHFLSTEGFAIVGVIVAVCMLLCTLPLPESPCWLIMHSKHDKAVHTFRYLYHNIHILSVCKLANESVGKGTISPGDFLQPTFYKPVALSIGLMFFQQFSGISAILYSTVSIFKQVNVSFDLTMGNLWVAMAMSIFTISVSFSMDTIGRKKYLYISGSLTSLSLIMMGVFSYLSAQNPSLKEKYGWISILILFAYVGVFSVGLGPIPWLMMPEMAPAGLRSIICGLGTAFSWLFVFIITKTFMQMEELVGDFGVYWICAGFCLMSCFFTRFFLPETKRKTMNEIENYFSGGELPLIGAAATA